MLRPIKFVTYQVSFFEQGDQPGFAQIMCFRHSYGAPQTSDRGTHYNMPDDHAFFRQILESSQHRPGGRAIIFDSSRKHLLVERNLGAREGYVNFPGGGIELGETLEACIRRELDEEFGGKVKAFEFLFLVENFIPFEGQVIGGIELYCAVQLEDDHVASRSPEYQFQWIDRSDLPDLDLRPHIVRDRIVDGTYPDVRHLVTNAK